MKKCAGGLRAIAGAGGDYAAGGLTKRWGYHTSKERIMGDCPYPI